MTETRAALVRREAAIQTAATIIRRLHETEFREDVRDIADIVEDAFLEYFHAIVPRFAERQFRILCVPGRAKRSRG